MDETPGTSGAGAPVEIRVQGLWKSFGDNEVLRGIDLTIRRGELVAIVGPSGCGKTVLLKHLMGHLTPDRGSVLIADHERPGSPLLNLEDLPEEPMDEIRVHWAIVFQRNALFGGTVFDNLALWPREIKRLSDEQIKPLAEKALRDVGMDPTKVMKLKREDLSGGMAKRVAVARALVMDPLLILYDEPTSGLDPVTASQIHELIERTHLSATVQGIARTSLIVTHDTELLRRLRPRVVMMGEGRICFDGPFEAFVRSDDPHIEPYVRQMPLLHDRRHE
ncbi:MAG: ATP-binding cassette domain-containing protein [Planctomycetes bacterium]|nr:ATP-binding cassette domain-containing protein [Planctomycetota bacterium]